jgi:hypothetical protein
MKYSDVILKNQENTLKRVLDDIDKDTPKNAVF